MAVERGDAARAGHHRGAGGDHRVGPEPGGDALRRSAPAESRRASSPVADAGWSAPMIALPACASHLLVDLPLFGGPIVMVVLAVVVMARSERRRGHDT